MAVIPAAEGSFEIKPGKHPYLPVRKDASFQWIPYLGTVLKADSEDTAVATIILPVEDEREAGKIADSVKRSLDNSGNLSLSFSKDGKAYRYEFTKGGDGFVLRK